MSPMSLQSVLDQINAVLGPGAALVSNTVNTAKTVIKKLILLPRSLEPTTDNPVTPTSGPTRVKDGLPVDGDTLKDVVTYPHMAAPGSMASSYTSRSGRRRTISLVVG